MQSAPTSLSTYVSPLVHHSDVGRCPTNLPSDNMPASTASGSSTATQSTPVQLHRASLSSVWPCPIPVTSPNIVVAHSCYWTLTRLRADVTNFCCQPLAGPWATVPHPSCQPITRTQTAVPHTQCQPPAGQSPILDGGESGHSQDGLPLSPQPTRRLTPPSSTAICYHCPHPKPCAQTTVLITTLSQATQSKRSFFINSRSSPLCSQHHPGFSMGYKLYCYYRLPLFYPTNVF